MELDTYWSEALSWLTALASDPASPQLVVPEALESALAASLDSASMTRVLGLQALAAGGELEEGAYVLLHRGLEEQWPDPVRIELFLGHWRHCQGNDVFSLLCCSGNGSQAPANKLARKLFSPQPPAAERSFRALLPSSHRRLLRSALQSPTFALHAARYQLDGLVARMIGTEGWESPTSPNTSSVGTELRDLALMKTNIKVLAWKVEQLEASQSQQPSAEATVLPIRQCLEQTSLGYPPSTKICTASDLSSAWHRNLCALIGATNPRLRKLWEWTYSLKVLADLGVCQRRGSGLGFGCGSEPMASLCANFAEQVLVTDAPPHIIDGKGWSDTNQHTASLNDAKFPKLAPGVDLDAVLGFEFVDMNAIPEALHDRFDFVWSSCALEHLGSKQKGLDFIVNSLRCLKPGGVAVHTTEYDLSGESTIDHWDTVLFNQADFEHRLPELVAQLEQIESGKKFSLMPLRLEREHAFLDGYVDIPPYAYHPSLNAGFQPGGQSEYAYPMMNLSVDGFPCTSIAVVIRRLS